jgi:cobalt-zinc-cadmium efflux system outer membrane protein
MRSKLLLAVACLMAGPSLAFGQTAVSQTGPIVVTSPRQAVDVALQSSPALRGADATRQAALSDRLQARLRPNPELTTSFENFGGVGGPGDYRGFRSLESTVGLSQRIELGGKRAARMGLAARGGEVAEVDHSAVRLDLAREVTIALAGAEAAARTVRLERERARLAAETLRAARLRVEAGRDPVLQAERAEVIRATAEIALERAQREVEIGLADLAVLLGVSRVELGTRQTWFEDIGTAPSPPIPADPLARLTANPDLVRLERVVEQQRANLTLQRSIAVPDITLSGDVRRFGDTRETAFVAGASIPLPFYDRNQGGIARAQAELLRAEAEAQRGRSALAAELVAAEQRTALAWRAVQSLRRDAVPAAERAARAASSGFAEGKFSFLEVLDAQRALSDARAQLLESYRDFHARRAAVERLRGQQPIADLTGGSR